MIILAIAAGIATFVENDFGSVSARALVYDNIWYEAIFALAVVNLLFTSYRYRLYLFKSRFLFHIAFVVILLGAGLTRYFGLDGSMHIREGESVSAMQTNASYLQVNVDGSKHNFKLEINAWGNNFSSTIPTINGELELKLSESIVYKEGLITSGYFDIELRLGNSHATQRFTHGMGNTPQKNRIKLGTEIIDIAYGALTIPLPFSIQLNDFELKRYPGNRSPSEYTSYLTLHDQTNNLTKDYTIFMNNTFVYGGYKFFQASYDSDEQGTILTLNQDPGKIPTYIGYALLFIGLIANLFDSSSRFSTLLARLRDSKLILLLVFILGFSTNSYASAIAQEKQESKNNYIQQYLEDHRTHSVKLATELGKLVVQTKGRMQPLNTLNREVLYKLSGKSSLLGMSADQVALGMVSHPILWQSIPMIKVKTRKLRDMIGIGDKNLASFNDFLDEKQQYKLQKEVDRVASIEPSKRSVYDNDLLKVDERLNISLLTYKGALLKLFPLPNDPNNRWLNLRESVFVLEDKETADTIHRAVSLILDSSFERNYERALPAIATIMEYQKREGSAIIPSRAKLDAELLWNSLEIFPRLIPAYLLLGFFTLIAAFGALFSARLRAPWLRKSLQGIALLLFLTQTFGLALRWYVSDHAPFSDTYESIVYISWSGMLCALLFFRRSLFALAASILVAGVFLFGAHLSHIDPEITTLAPVLKSFWLTLHVSVITASYGFFGVGAFLGFFSLLLFILKSYVKTQLSEPIARLSDLNEVSLILGLTLLVIGNFLGGIWANESWGRYWAWDPKETWSYISILIYSIILHVRFLYLRHYEYVFALLSMWGFGSILMTYFGVNFYLAGLHSYAQGDPLPIPAWVYTLTLALGILSFVSFFHRELQTKNKGNL